LLNAVRTSSLLEPPVLLQVIDAQDDESFGKRAFVLGVPSAPGVEIGVAIRLGARHSGRLMGLLPGIGRRPVLTLPPPGYVSLIVFLPTDGPYLGTTPS
jgi:hypothetical protein